jgi:hypothetical protein
MTALLGKALLLKCFLFKSTLLEFALLFLSESLLLQLLNGETLFFSSFLELIFVFFLLFLGFLLFFPAFGGLKFL